ncbi:MAG: PilN domain-containing protein [Candidatus Omnitrophica bacterium]|nr:PilN domain-containing protein [Candidatus Omnitrophota bacterium]
MSVFCWALFMLTINLLPESYRKTTATPLPQLHRSPLVSVVLAIVLGVTVLLALVRQIRQMQLHHLKVQLQQLTPQRVEADRLRVALQQLRVQQTSFEGLHRGESAWAKRLNALSDATPEGIWFTSLSVDPAHGLVIEGSALGQEGQEMAQVGQLVQNLKDQTAFSSAVQDIQIESIKSVKEDDVELTLFTLTCALSQ